MKKYVIIALLIVIFIIYVAVTPDWGNSEYEYIITDCNDWPCELALAAIKVKERDGEMKIVSVQNVGSNEIKIVIEASSKNGQEQIENIFKRNTVQYRRIR